MITPGRANPTHSLGNWVYIHLPGILIQNAYITFYYKPRELPAYAEPSHTQVADPASGETESLSKLLLLLKNHKSLRDQANVTPLLDMPNMGCAAKTNAATYYNIALAQLATEQRDGNTFPVATKTKNL